MKCEVIATTHKVKKSFTTASNIESKLTTIETGDKF